MLDSAFRTHRTHSFGRYSRVAQLGLVLSKIYAVKKVPIDHLIAIKCLTTRVSELLVLRVDTHAKLNS